MGTGKRYGQYGKYGWQQLTCSLCTQQDFEDLLSVAPHFQAAPREGKVLAEVPHRVSSSPAEDPVSHWCRGTRQWSEWGAPAWTQTVPGVLQHGSDFKELLLGQKLNQGKAELGQRRLLLRDVWRGSSSEPSQAGGED